MSSLTPSRLDAIYRGILMSKYFTKGTSSCHLSLADKSFPLSLNVCDAGWGDVDKLKM